MKDKPLKPQDLLVAMKLAVFDEGWNFKSLANSLGISVGGLHDAVDRAKSASLLSGKKQKHGNGDLKVNRRALAEFMIHGAKYAFPARASRAKVRGIPTADAIDAINKHLAPGGQLHWVWPDDEGIEEGYSCNPLHKLAPGAAKQDVELYQMLALLDSQRVGDARVREIGTQVIKEKLGVE